jgi:hypothetical protein
MVFGVCGGKRRKLDSGKRISIVLSATKNVHRLYSIICFLSTAWVEG